MRGVAALLAGALFGSGLLLSGMSNPQTVLGFLDVAGAWNPALAFTMAGAIAVAAPAFWWSRRHAPIEAGKTRIDARLLAGSALFGFGWGLSGICPGPGLLLLTGFTLPAWVFVATMALGMLLAARWPRAAGV
jgi:hypothetical protein